MLALMKREIPAIRMALALECEVNDWIRKKFSSKNFADTRIKDWAIVSQFALGETKSMQCAVVERGNAQLVKEMLPDFLAAAETFQRSSSRLFVESSG